jgi:uncharacterized membrane protein YfcA
MPDPTAWLVLVVTALAGSLLGGIAGFGAGILLLPVVATVLGVRAAVPVLTITMLLGNLSRVWWSRGELDRAVTGRFLLGAIPATALGTALVAAAPSDTVRIAMGCFLLAASPLRRVLASGGLRVRLAHFPVLGAALGALSAVVVTTGPVVTPFFLAYGLRRGAYIASEAVCALGMHLARGTVLARYRLLTWETVVVGVVLGATMFLGSWAGRRLLDRVSDRVFLVVVEVLLVGMGLHMLLGGR